MSYAEMMAMRDKDDLFDDSESEEKASKISTPTPIGPVPSVMKATGSQSSVVHTINVNYRHHYSLERQNRDKVDIPELLQSLVQHTSLQSPSKVLQPSHQLPPTRDAVNHMKPKVRTLR